MLGVMVREQLRRQGVLLITTLAIAAALPALSVRALFGQGVAVEAFMLMQAAGLASPIFPLLAIFLGVAMGTGAWQQDHESGHVYALSLPLPRWHYALLRLAAGFTLILPAVLVLALSATIISAAIEVPPGLHTYPWPLTVRFFATTVVAYTTVFAMASGGRRTAGWAVLGLFVAVFIDVGFQSRFELEYSPLFNFLLGTHSPLSFFAGQWTLVDV